MVRVGGVCVGVCGEGRGGECVWCNCEGSG